MIMPKSEVEPTGPPNGPAPELTAWNRVQMATNEQERYDAAMMALSTHRFTHTGKEIPLLAMDLPWADDSSTVDNILAQLIAAPHIEDVSGGQDQLTKLVEIIDMPVEVFDVRVRESDVEGDGSWGIYLSLDLSVRDGRREVVNTGARQVIVTLWRLWCEGKFPVSGMFVKLGNPTPGRSQPVGFRTEDPF